MDLGLFFRVLFRQKVLLLVGMLVAVVVGTFIAYKPTSSGLAPRSLQYTSSARLVVTDGPAEPFATSTPQTVPGSNVQLRPGFAPGDLADLYAQYIMGDPIINQVESVYGKLSAHNASVTAFRILAQSPNGFGVTRPRPLPMIEVDATADTPKNARVLAQLTSDAFQRYVNEQQNNAKLPVERRTTVDLVLAPKAGTRSSSNPLVLLILIAVGLFVLVVALAGVRENLQRRRARRAVGPAPVTTGTDPSLESGNGPFPDGSPVETPAPADVMSGEEEPTVGAPLPHATGMPLRRR